MFADYLIICLKVLDEIPEVYVMRRKEYDSLVVYSEKKGVKSWWIQPPAYEPFKDKWNKIGRGFV